MHRPFTKSANRIARRWNHLALGLAGLTLIGASLGAGVGPAPTPAKKALPVKPTQPGAAPAASPPVVPASAPPGKSRPIDPAPGDDVPQFLGGLNAQGYFSLKDRTTNREIFANPILPVFYDTNLQPTITQSIKPNGIDLTLTYRNTTNQPQRLGTIGFTGARFPARMDYYRFGQDTTVLQTSDYKTIARDVYPNGTYSPVLVFGDPYFTVGVSLCYPAIVYNHPVNKFIVPTERQNDDGGPSWAVGFQLSDSLQPGQTRAYIVTVRVASSARKESWLSTVAPYRDYFQSFYGPVRYKRATDQVRGDIISFADLCGPGNPRGFSNPSLRPDTLGWQPWVDKVLADAARYGEQRVMLWNPSGCFQYSNLNFPFQFMTGILDLPQAASTLPEFWRAEAGGLEVGFWWGHSVFVMDSWNATTGHPLNPLDPHDVQLAFNELDTATIAGATIIGLDGFVLERPGDSYYWLLTMQARAPRVKFVTENAASDLIHNLAPTFHEASSIKNPHLLADFINPGHETWAAITSWPSSGKGRKITPVEQNAEIERLATYGFVPLIYGNRPASFKAASASESWKTTIPLNLQATDIRSRLAVKDWAAAKPKLPEKYQAMANLPMGAAAQKLAAARQAAGSPVGAPARVPSPGPNAALGDQAAKAAIRAITVVPSQP